ncbi:hypothetical protein Vafri_3821 [Volvox africanus]|uniref:RCC1-like domain-containing protein n=2 Tax=Volvox africanus TaxID=51714 RepID=A0A8J4EV74_9CHLO|nr:hypothetical protein Vafri_3821 [Volvox africanus]
MAGGTESKRSKAAAKRSKAEPAKKATVAAKRGSKRRIEDLTVEPSQGPETAPASAEEESPPAEKPVSKRRRPDSKAAKESQEPEPASAKEGSIPTEKAEKAVPHRNRGDTKVVKTQKLPDGALLYMFGTNSFGALGLGDPDKADDPDTCSQIPRPKYPVLEGVVFCQVACGGMHTVALSEDGLIYSWGVNDEGALGRKTSGTCWEKEPDNAKTDSFVPCQAHLPNGMKAVQIVAGDGFTFALGADDRLYGCGFFKDEVGALSGFTPKAKMLGLFTMIWEPESSRDRIKQLACGARHAVFLTYRGDVYTWGSGSQGQLGRVQPYSQDSEYQPTASELFQPTRVTHLPYALGNTSASIIACGAYSTFVLGKNGDVAAWGLNNSGQLGIVKESEEDNLLWEPVSVDSLAGVVNIAGGEHHTLALTKKGVLLSFGAGTYGMLGRRDVDITTANVIHPEPKPVDGLDGVKVVSIVAGTNVSACTTSDGDAYFWGSNTNLQLAKGTDDDDEALPKKMGRVKAFGYRRIHSVCFGGQHGALLAGLEGDTAPSSAAGPAAAPTGAGPGPSIVTAPVNDKPAGAEPTVGAKRKRVENQEENEGHKVEGADGQVSSAVGRVEEDAMEADDQSEEDANSKSEGEDASA